MSSDSIRRKIASLLKMTSASGCTEAEALAAAEKAAALMLEHGLSEADITIGEAMIRTKSKGRTVRDALWNTVAYCSNTAATFRHCPGKQGAELIFVGREPGPEIATYLVTVLGRAIDTSVAEFRAGAFFRRRRTDATRKAATRDFTIGMVVRLQARLVEVFGPQISRNANALATAARDDRFAGAKPVGKARTADMRFADAVIAGMRAGQRVHLAHGVDGQSAEPRQIGRAR